MAHARSVLLPLLASIAAVVSLTPGCSNKGPAAAQTAVHFTILPGANGASCQVGPGVDWSIGDPPNVVTVSDGGRAANGVPISVQCRVTGSDSAGYTVLAQARYGNIGSFLVSGSFPGGVAGVVPTATNVHGEFNSGATFIANLSQDGCTVTFQGHQGIAPGQVWGTIDCPAAADAKNGETCEGTAEFLFENCGT